MSKVTAATPEASTPSLTFPCPRSWAGAVLPCLTETIAQRMRERPPQSATHPHQAEQHGFLGGMRESVRWAREGGGGSVRLGREGPVAAREGEAFFLVKSWLPLAKEQI